MKQASISDSELVDRFSLLSVSTLQEEVIKHMDTKNKERLQFDFTPESLERLDRMKELAQASTRAEVVRNALKLYEWFLNDIEPENTIKVFDKDNEIISAFK